MKGYAILILLLAVLLLLIPLPALPHAQPAAVAPLPTVFAPESAAPAAKTFKILVGDTVTELDEREFLIRTLAFEMPPTYHAEALKAQAVAAYTYYARRRAAPDAALKGADFATPDTKFPAEYDSNSLQQRWGEQYTAYYRKLCEAVDAVMGKTVTYNGELIDACYFAISGGATASAKTVWGNDVAYLQSVASPGDRLAPNYESVISMAAADLKQAVSAAHADVTWGDDPATWLTDPVCADGDTVASMRVGDKTLTGNQVRTALSLRSSCFTVKYADGTFTFTVHGYGHGVGMSQYGADYLARQGYSYEEILRHYYTGTTVG